MYTCACDCYVVAMCMWLFFVTYLLQVLEQVQHPLSLVLDGKNEVYCGLAFPLGRGGEAAQLEAALHHRTVDVL